VRQENERCANEIEHHVRSQVTELHRMSSRLVTHRLTPAIPNPAIMLIGDEPVTKPSQPKHYKNNARRQHPQNFATLKLPSEHKRRDHEPRCIKSDRLAQIYSQTQ